MFANKVLMVRPVDFAFNPQTGVDNEFQHQVTLSHEQIRTQALTEFSSAVSHLQQVGVTVLVLEKCDEQSTPDAVFPNNWFATDSKGNLYLFPMKTENRRHEVRPTAVAALLRQSDLKVAQLIEVGSDEDQVLEGTGAIVFDHKLRLAYAALSERCHEPLLNHYCRQIDYQPIHFQSQSSNGKPIYHTNVLMSVGQDFVVVCTEAINQAERQRVIECIHRSSKKLIDITMAQMEQHFCANILELKNADGERVLALSQKAWDGFTPQQQTFFKDRMIICANDISTIETVGGGSMRCMLAEVFNPAIS